MNVWQFEEGVCLRGDLLNMNGFGQIWTVFHQKFVLRKIKKNMLIFQIICIQSTLVLPLYRHARELFLMSFWFFG